MPLVEKRFRYLTRTRANFTSNNKHNLQHIVLVVISSSNCSIRDLKLFFDHHIVVRMLIANFEFHRSNFKNLSILIDQTSRIKVFLRVEQKCFSINMYTSVRLVGPNYGAAGAAIGSN